MNSTTNISIDKELHDRLKTKVLESIFRNTNHLVEHTVESFLKDNQNE